MLAREEKQRLIVEFRIHDKDVGSPEVRISILTRRIEELSRHLREFPNDVHSKRGLLVMVGKRRKLLRYLKKLSPERYQGLLGKLGLRK
jgi:small subunit ribosomal protein S15